MTEKTQIIEEILTEWLKQLDLSWEKDLFEIREDFHKLYGANNPYLIVKSTFMSQGIPVQGIEIETIQEDKLIGNVAITSINWVNRTAEYGIAIWNKQYWDQGIGTEATQLSLNYAFNQLNFNTKPPLPPQFLFSFCMQQFGRVLCYWYR